MKKTWIQIYEVQKPAEAGVLVSLGVDHIGSVLISEDRWKQPVIRRTVQAVQSSGAKSGIIPISKDPVKIFAALDYYRPDFVHLCDTLWIFNYFESFGAVFVIENVYRGYDPVEVPSHVKDPVDYLAWRAFLRYTTYHEKARARSGNPTVEKLLGMIEDYKIDGVVFHACRSCRATTIGQTHMKNELSKYSDLPMIQLVSDMVDLRDYSEAQWKAQISAFIEALTARSRG